MIEVDSLGLSEHLYNGQIYVTVVSIDLDFIVHQYAAKIHFKYRLLSSTKCHGKINRHYHGRLCVKM